MGDADLREAATVLIGNGLDHMSLEYPKGFKRPHGWPRGELMCVNSAGNSVYRVKCQRVIDWIDAAEQEGEKPC